MGYERFYVYIDLGGVDWLYCYRFYIKPSSSLFELVKEVYRVNAIIYSGVGIALMWVKFDKCWFICHDGKTVKACSAEGALYNIKQMRESFMQVEGIYANK